MKHLKKFNEEISPLDNHVPKIVNDPKRKFIEKLKKYIDGSNKDNWRTIEDSFWRVVSTID